ncbi:MAG: flagellar assembly protein FliW [Bacillota bacterium]|nr:flagellar assembly protein FliW [Bacillota bacterium]
MNIETRFLGPITINQSQIITFPDGIPAFEEEKQYILLPMEENAPFFYLQSVKTPDLCFILAAPFTFFPAYQVELSEEQETKLQPQSEKDLAVLTVLNIPEDFKQTTANLMAPVIINLNKNKGIQYVPPQSAYNTRQPLFPQNAQTESAAAQEGK